MDPTLPSIPDIGLPGPVDPTLPGPVDPTQPGTEAPAPTDPAQPGTEAPGTIVVDPYARVLYHVQPGGQAMRYVV